MSEKLVVSKGDNNSVNKLALARDTEHKNIRKNTKNIILLLFSNIRDLKKYYYINVFILILIKRNNSLDEINT